MSSQSKLLITAAFLLCLVGIGSADALFTRSLIMLPSLGDTEEIVPPPTDQPPPPDNSGGITKQSGPNVREVLQALGLEQSTTQDVSIIRRVIPEEINVQTTVLLKDGDRIGMISWAETPLVKTYFLALKEALHTSFTAQMTDLVDETQRPEGKPVRNFLTFLDPGLSPERLVFIRVRERMYEFHIAEGKDDQMFLLVEALTN